MSEEVLTIDEINRRYAGEWILVEDPETNPDLKVVSGKVVCHSTVRDEVYRCALERQPRSRRVAVLRIGDWPRDVVVIL